MHVHCTFTDHTQACVGCVQQFVRVGRASFQRCSDPAPLVDWRHICYSSTSLPITVQSPRNGKHHLTYAKCHTEDSQHRIRNIHVKSFCFSSRAELAISWGLLVDGLLDLGVCGARLASPRFWGVP